MELKKEIFLILLLLLSSLGMSEVESDEGREFFGMDMKGPETHVALGGSPLTLDYKLDSPNTNTTDFHPLRLLSLSIQLTFLEYEDGTESFVATNQIHPTPTQWNQVSFECGLIVHGGVYHIRLIDTGAEEDDDSLYFYIKTYNGLPLKSQNTIRLRTNYPTIDFDVPHRLEAYTPNVLISFGLTKTLCQPLRPLTPTELLLSRIPSEEEGIKGSHLTSFLLDNPLLRLQKEGRVSVAVDCQFWARNSTYRVEIREKLQKRRLIARSGTIKVDWSWKFGLRLSKGSVVPCRRNIRVFLSYPDCVLIGRDKVRVYGYESLPVPSLLAPRRQSYIAERQIQSNTTDGKTLLFPCALFPQRFSKYCFQYVNIAEDESVAVVTESCIPTFPPDEFTDGGWGSWSLWSECSTSCGAEGKQFRYRYCDSPQPSFGGNFCSGESIQEKICEDKGIRCPSPPPIVVTLAANESPEVEYPQYHWPRERWDLSKNYRHEYQRSGIPTAGCECGCILHDLRPGFNYSLVVALSSNHSACEDEDEEEHHNLKWILHARNSRDRIKFQIQRLTVQCVSLTFRDGNTSDSNLLQLLNTVSGEDDIESIETTGSSLSIGASDETHQNCSLPSMYFFGYYEVLPLPLAESDPFFNWKDFWTFLFLKLSLLIFLVIAFVSIVSGCAKKVYDYKELKWSRTEDEEERMDHLVNSRTTSVTLMSFDHAYHAYLRRLRLKNFLLRPRKLNLITARVKSLPNTPNSRRKNVKSTPRGRESGTDEEKLLLKSISLSDTDLERHRNTLNTEVPDDEVPQSKVTIIKSTELVVVQGQMKMNSVREKQGGDDTTSYTASEVNSMNDLEMDYYDYDIQNAGNIPGSYLLEQPYVIWTESIYDNSFSDPGGDQGIELLNTSTSMGGTSSSMGLFTSEPKDFSVMETSFDTLDGYHIKFVDDDDEEGDTRTISDSLPRDNYLSILP